MFKNLVYTLVALLCCETVYGLEISFQDTADVSSSYVSLGDVVRFDETTPLTTSLATKIVAKSPSPGESLFINAIEIKKQILRKNNLGRDTRWSGANVIKIYRQGQQVLPERLIGAIDAFLGEESQTLPKKASISFKPRSLPLPFMLPEGEVSIEVVPSNPKVVKSSRFSLIIRVNGKVRKNLSIQGNLQVLAPVLVTQAPLKRGTILTPANTAMAIKDLTENNNPYTNQHLAMGKRLKRSLRSGSAIDAEDVEILPLVKKGQLVKVIYTQNNLYLTATGVARSNGILDQIIRVQNANSHKIILCRVAAPGIVEVKI